ncbi:MAG: efflux RND transporter periplasmic adaptor subunit [Gemmatimonadota bacterium]|nr:efflux RND transporter periplasmic adaptor subunit [Gemmatimonadota bacterium]
MTEKISQSARWALLAGALVLVAAAIVWAATRTGGGAERTAAAAEMEGMEMGGMEMSGMQMGDGTVRIDPQMVRSLGITLATAELGPVRREIRTTGNVTFDETRLSTITPKFGGFVERLYVDFTGQAVRRGQPLLEIYSPELVSAQEELLAAARLERQLAQSAAPGVAERSGGLVEAARRRLLLWDISPAQIQQIERTGQVRRTLTLHAPFTGFVVEKNVQQGQSVQPGEALYRLADLTQVWVEADVYEQDLRFVRLGEPVSVEIAAYPGERLTGRVSYLYPEVRQDTRTARVRIPLANPGGRIKPGMFATVHLDAPEAERALLVPRDAVMRTGTRDIVFVEQGPGAYELREVRVGSEVNGDVQILSGLLAGERVVARANFLLDAESRLMETMMGQPGMPGMEMNPGDTSMPGMQH